VHEALPPSSNWQAPCSQLPPAGQAKPHPPQFAGSALVSAQTAPQQLPGWPETMRQVAPAVAGPQAIAGLQAPLMQSWPFGQALPQAPQFASSQRKSVQVPLQQMPLASTAVAGSEHTVPATPEAQVDG